MRNLGFASNFVAMIAVWLGGVAVPSARAQTARPYQAQAGGLIYCYPSAGGYVPSHAGGSQVPPEIWRSYAPGSAWMTPRYGVTARRPAPSTIWRSYSGIPGGGVFRSFGRAIGRLRGGNQPISSMNLEFGTGRNVGMIKPWLPEGVD